MIQEIAAVMRDRIAFYFGTPGTATATLKTIYMFYEPVMAKRGYPYVLIHPARSTETMLTTTQPLIEAFYLLEVVDRYMTTSDESAAQLSHQRSMQAADSIKELLRNDSTVRGLCMDFRAVRTEPKIAQVEDATEVRQPVEIRATFNNDAGIYGYSLYGFAIYGSGF